MGVAPLFPATVKDAAVAIGGSVSGPIASVAVPEVLSPDGFETS